MIVFSKAVQYTFAQSNGKLVILILLSTMLGAGWFFTMYRPLDKHLIHRNMHYKQLMQHYYDLIKKQQEQSLNTVRTTPAIYSPIECIENIITILEKEKITICACNLIDKSNRNPFLDLNVEGTEEHIFASIMSLEKNNCVIKNVAIKSSDIGHITANIIIKIR